MSGVETAQVGTHREDVFLNGRRVGYIVRMLEGLPIAEVMWGFACPEDGEPAPMPSRALAIKFVIGAVPPEGHA